MKQRLIATCLALGLFGSIPALGQGVTFDIQRFEIKGSTLLPAGQADDLVKPFTGKDRSYADIQKALEAIEAAYRAKGYGAVNVRVPEQEITTGIVRLDVVEAVIGKLVIDGNTRFVADNIRASLPNLKDGQTPNLSDISENVQLANENPAKQVEVTLATAEQPGMIDAKIKVVEQNPQRFFVTLDNTGTNDTGRHRLGVAYQHANLLGGDEVLTLAYTGSPDVWLGHPDDVKVDIYSVAFHKPFYGLGDSLDIIYGKSNVDVPTAQTTGFGITGKGEVIALRWNHNFPRRGEYSSKLVFGYDYKLIDASCDPDAKGLIGTCTPYTVQPVSATYQGQWQGIGYQGAYNAGLAYNLFASGRNYPGLPGTPADGHDDKYSFVTNRPVDDHFMVARFGGSYSRLFNDWQLRAAFSGQAAIGNRALPSSEQFGLVGSTAVRGFSERVISTDSGYFFNLEAYTPNLAGLIKAPGNLHGVVFYDVGEGRNAGADGTPYDKIGVASIGLGVRYSFQRDVTFSWDAASVLDPGDKRLSGVHENKGDWRSHFKLTIGF